MRDPYDYTGAVNIRPYGRRSRRGLRIVKRLHVRRIGFREQDFISWDDFYDGIYG